MAKDLKEILFEKLKFWEDNHQWKENSGAIYTILFVTVMEAGLKGEYDEWRKEQDDK